MDNREIVGDTVEALLTKATKPLGSVSSQVETGTKCFLPGCTFDTLEFGMYNHLVYNQVPHHSLKQVTAMRMYDEWSKRPSTKDHSKISIGKSLGLIYIMQGMLE